MTGKPEDFLVQDAHADAEATRKAIAAATDAQTLLGLIASGYKQWLDATQQFYRLPAKPGVRATP